MITDKIKALFQFIEFLHSNIENFNQYNEVINELGLLFEKRSSLKPRNNFVEKQKYDEIQAVIKEKFSVIQEKIIQPIQVKAIELNICDIDQPETLWNWNIAEINRLKANYNVEDLPQILNHKNLYIEFRTVTNCTYFQNSFFSGLDEILKELFDFFKQTEQNEFEAFEIKPIEVNNITEMAEILSGKNKLKIDIDENLSITDKLNYWLGIAQTYIFEPLERKFGIDYWLSTDNRLINEVEYEKEKILVQLYGFNHNARRPLWIPWEYRKKHFPKEIDEPEFTYWFLQYNAKQYFEIQLKAPHFQEEISSNLAEQSIKAKLKPLNDFEAKAEQLLNESKFEIYKEYTYSEYEKEIEFFRIKAGYYKTHALPNVNSKGNKTVVLYAEHIYLKEYLENELAKLQKSSDPYEHYLKTGRTPFTCGIIPIFNVISQFSEDKIKYEDKFNRFKTIIESIKDIKGKNILINDAIDLIGRFIDNSKSTNYREFFSSLQQRITELKALPQQPEPQPTARETPTLKEKSITFNSLETIEKLFSELKAYFPNKENELLSAMKGEVLTEMLLFPHNQNKFVEVFKRLKYNGFILNTPTEIRNWLCSNFMFRKKQGNTYSLEPFNQNTVWDILTKDKGEPTKKERICIVDWLPYKSHTQIQRETEIEKL